MLTERIQAPASSGSGWTIERAAGTVTARFSGRLGAEEGAKAVKEFANLIGSDRCRVVFDIREMSGYDSDARRAWATTLRPLRAQLESIELIGGNAMVRMGGTVLGAMIGVPVTTRN